MLRTITASLCLSVFHSEVLLAQAVDYGAVHAWQTYGDPDSASVAVAFACMVALCCVSIAYLGRLLQVDTSEGKRLGERFASRFSFHAQDLGGFSLGRLAIVSVTLLLLELVLIRWISSEIRIFAYFKNFVLIACFLGFGLGCYFCRRRSNLLSLMLPLLLFTFFITVPWPPMRKLVESLPSFIGIFSDVQLWGVHRAEVSVLSAALFLAAVSCSAALFALVSAAFIPLGQLVGWYLEEAPNGIVAYSVNVLASLAGILLFIVMCFFNQPPAVWFGCIGVMVALLLWRQSRLLWSSVAAMSLAVAALTINVEEGKTTHWSPYQKLSVGPIEHEDETIGYWLLTNNTWYQKIIDLSPEFLDAHPDLVADTPTKYNAYNIPFLFYPNPASVLVLGAGMGNDVAAALRNTSASVVAVEIDPLIIRLGQELHLEQPYSSDRVRVVVDDARSFIENTKERFDLILFSLLDSHTTSSHYTNIRIDNYVYTIESLRAVRELLAADGIVVVKFQVNTPWIAGRLEGLMREVFGHPPLHIQSEFGHTTPGRFFISGSQERLASAVSDDEFGAYLAKRGQIDVSDVRLTTDDWPYFYQRDPGLPMSVVVMSGVLVVLFVVALKWSGLRTGPSYWHFFFLGAGFLLLEVQSVSKMALLFGTTWLVNSVVISVILLLVVGANLIVQKKQDIPTSWAYVGLLATIGVAYFVPLQWFFFESLWLRGVAATLVLCLPVLFASVVFIQSFAGAGFKGTALGSNLMGALVGGLLEGFSLWAGLSSLLVIAGGLYVGAYLAAGRSVVSRNS